MGFFHRNPYLLTWRIWGGTLTPPILLSFRVCVHARVFVHAYESGRNYIHACNKKFYEGIMLVENEPPCGESWLRA